MRFQTKVSALAIAVALAATGLAVESTAASAGTKGVAARPGAPGKPKIVKIKSTDHKVTMSDQKFHPGVTEFRVVKTAHKGSSLVILETKDLDRSFQLLGKAFGGGPGSADAMKKFDNSATLYGGGAVGTHWQVKLSKGSYYMLDTKTNKLTTFKLNGENRTAKFAHPDSEIWATPQNQWGTSGDLSGPWVSFTNKAHEIHFMEADRVAKSTTSKDVKKALMSNKQPKWIRPGGFFFDVQSPGVKTVHRQDIDKGKYLLVCFMPSEEQDGVPHALMGMWRLQMAS